MQGIYSKASSLLNSALAGRGNYTQEQVDAARKDLKTLDPIKNTAANLHRTGAISDAEFEVFNSSFVRATTDDEARAALNRLKNEKTEQPIVEANLKSMAARAAVTVGYGQ